MDVPPVSAGGGLVNGMVLGRMEPSRHAAGRVNLSVDGHYSDDYGASVYVSDDHGATWQPIVSGLLAAAGPARRGLRVQPTEALREER